MAQFTYYPATKLFDNIPPQHQIFKSRYTGVFKAPFRSAYSAQSQSVLEPALIENPKKPGMLKID
jgi:hypothetical protein